MLKENSSIFVKGFAKNRDFNVIENDPSKFNGDQFIAIVTDLVTTDKIEITSATWNGTKWVLECTNGTTLAIEKEPVMPRILKEAKIVTNVIKLFSQWIYDEVPLTEEIMKAIDNGNKGYRLVGSLNTGDDVITSRIVKLWIDPSGIRHAKTKSGSHYILK